MVINFLRLISSRKMSIHLEFYALSDDLFIETKNYYSICENKNFYVDNVVIISMM